MDLFENEKSLIEIIHKMKNEDYNPSKKDGKLIHFCYDPLAKYIFRFHIEFTKILINSIHGIEVNSIEESYTENVPRHLNSKQTINDLCFTVNGSIPVIFEVQNLANSDKIYTRSQCYGYERALVQFNKGNKYEITPIYISFLLKDGKDFPTLIEDGNYLFGSNVEHSLVHCKIVHLAVINRITQEKGIENLSIFEKIIYVLNNGIDDDILKAGGEVIRKMDELKEQWMALSPSQIHAYFVESYMAFEERASQKEKEEFNQMKIELHQMDSDLKQKDFELKQMDSDLKQKDFELKQMDSDLKQKENLLHQKEKELKQREEQLNQKEQLLSAR